MSWELDAENLAGSSREDGPWCSSVDQGPNLDSRGVERCSDLDGRAEYRRARAVGFYLSPGKGVYPAQGVPTYRA